MFHTPPHKLPAQRVDQTLSDYIKRKGYEAPQKRSFNDYANEMVLTAVGPRPRHHAWGEEKTAFAQQIWEEAQK